MPSQTSTFLRFLTTTALRPVWTAVPSASTCGTQPVRRSTTRLRPSLTRRRMSSSSVSLLPALPLTPTSGINGTRRCATTVLVCLCCWLALRETCGGQGDPGEAKRAGDESNHSTAGQRIGPQHQCGAISGVLSPSAGGGQRGLQRSSQGCSLPQCQEAQQEMCAVITTWGCVRERDFMKGGISVSHVIVSANVCCCHFLFISLHYS